MMRVRNMRALVILMMPMTIHGIIVAAAITVVAVILVPLFMSALRKSSRIATCYDLLLETYQGCRINAI